MSAAQSGETTRWVWGVGVKEIKYIFRVNVAFGLMSPSALCRLRPNVVQLNVEFELMSFGLMSHSAIYRLILMSSGLLSFGLLSLGVMSFGLLSVYRGKS